MTLRSRPLRSSAANAAPRDYVSVPIEFHGHTGTPRDVSELGVCFETDQWLPIVADCRCGQGGPRGGRWRSICRRGAGDDIRARLGEAEMRWNHSPEAVTLSFAGRTECARHGESYA